MTSLLKIYCFGGFYAELDGHTLSGFRTQKTQALLAYLTLEGGRPLARTQLANLLWHGYQPNTALASLRVALGNLRQRLAPLNVISATRQNIRWLGAPPTVWCDAWELNAFLASAEEPTATQLHAALQLYSGDFLQGYEAIDSQPFQAWLSAQRVHYQAQAELLRQRLTPPVTQQPELPAHNLPRTFTSLIGRETPIAEVRQLLLDGRQPLVTLLGEGGIGKTRLAVAVAQSIYDVAARQAEPAAALSLAAGATPHSKQPLTHIKPPFADGLWFVALAGVVPLRPEGQTPHSATSEEEQTEEAIAHAIAKTLALSFTGVTPLRRQLGEQLQSKNLLLVLDNMEHLTSGRNLLVALLQQARGVSILVTTRQRLNLQAEYLYRVTELPLPPGSEGMAESRSVAAYASVQLFVERARNTTPGFALTAANQATVVQICHKLGGVPLALELAATQIEKYNAAEILRNLQTNLTGLTTDLADVAPRHRDLRRVLATSWQLLPPSEAQVLAQCAVFQGGFTPEAAAAVCANVAGLIDEHRLNLLVDKSLLQCPTEGRYQFHEIVRQYAAEQLGLIAPAAGEARRRHAAYFTALLARQLATLYTTPTTSQRIRADLDNIRSAWHWLVETADFATLNTALVPFALFQFYTGAFQEMHLLAEAALIQLRPRLHQPTDATEQRTIGLLLATQAFFAGELGRIDAAFTLAQAARQLGEELNDPQVKLMAYLPLNLVARMQGRLGILQAQKAVVLAQRFVDESPHLVVHFLGDLGRALLRASAIPEAVETYEAAIQLADQYQVHLLGGVLLYQFSQLQARLGDWARVHQLAQQALTIHQTWGYVVGGLHSLLSLVTYAYAVGDYAQMALWAQQVLTLSRDYHTYELELLALIWQSKAQARLGKADEAQRNLAAAAVLSEKLGNRAQQAWVRVEQGRVALQLHNEPEAQAAGEAALALVQLSVGAEYQAAARAVLAQVYARQQDSEKAGEQVAMILQIFEQTPAGRQQYEQAWVYSVCYEVLHSQQDPLAQQVLAQARTWLQAEAEKISDEVVRQTFLTNVPEHQLLINAA